MGHRFSPAHHLPSATGCIKQEELAEAIVSSQIGRTKLSAFSIGLQMSTAKFLDGLQANILESGDDLVPSISASPRYRWRNLRQLCLRSSAFSATNAWEIERVLLLAAGAVPNLPKLQTMEIWGSCSEGIAHILQYKTEQGQPEITWTFSRKQRSRLSPRVTAYWTRVINHVHSELPPPRIVEKLFTESVEEMNISQGSFIIKYLALRRLCFDAVTFVQREVETEKAMRKRQLHYRKGSY